MGFTILTLLLSWPLPLRFEDAIPTLVQPADPMALLYGLAASAESLLHHPLHPFQASFFHPHPAPLVYLDLLFGPALLAAPLFVAGATPALAYNVVWVLSFVLSGLGAYGLARYLGTSRLAAGLAGMAFAFHPFRWHNAGQLNVLTMMWIPFTLLCLHAWVDSGRRRYLGFAAGLTVLQVLSGAYGAFLLGLAVLLYLGVLLLGRRAAILALLRRDGWVIGAWVLAGGFVLLPFALPYLQNLSRDPEYQRSLGETALYSALPLDFLTPARNSILGGLLPWASAARHPLFPGVIASTLALVAIFARAWRGTRHRAEWIFYLWLLAVFAVLSLGPVLEMAGTRVPLPFAGMYVAIPGASLLRAPVRFVVPAVLAGSLLAGLGLDRLRARGFPTWAGTTLVLLLAVELTAVPLRLLPVFPDGIPDAYAWLANADGKGAVVELPLPPDEKSETPDEARFALYSLTHGRRTGNGVGGFVPPATRKLRRVMQGFPDPESLDLLRKEGIEYVVVHTDLVPEHGRRELTGALAGTGGLAPVYEEGPILIYRVLP